MVDHEQAHHLTSEGARSAAFAWGRMGQAIECCSRILGSVKALWQDRIQRSEEIRRNLRHEVSILQRVGRLGSARRRWPQATQG